jgi:serine/threonine protein kinase
MTKAKTPKKAPKGDVLRSIGRYEIRRELGRGMMGVVYEAQDPDLGRTVALKTIRLTLAGDERQRQEYERRFRAEAQIAARLSHPGLVTVHDTGQDSQQGILYMALEYLHGRTLAEVVAEKGRLEWREVLRIVARVAEALHYAHGQGVIHRDVKPANIMVLDSREPKIMDFGIAKLDSSQLTTTGQVFGTPLYMSPEQSLGHTVDNRTDIFSLGSVAYTLLTGKPAFEAPIVPVVLARVAYFTPPPPSEAVRGLPADVDYVVARAMAKAPSDRYADAKMMAEDAGDVAVGRPPRHRGAWVEPPLSAPEGAPRSEKPRARPLRFLVRLVVLLVLLAGAYLYYDPAARQSVRDELGRVLPASLLQDLAARLPKLTLPTLPPRPAPATLAPVAAPSAGPIVASPPSSAPEAAPSPAKASERDAAAPGKLTIDFQHDVRRGTITVLVDGKRMLEDDFDSRVTRKTLQPTLTLSPGRHDVRVQVKWEDHLTTGRLFGTFGSGATRRLDVKVSRARGNVSLAWK